MKKKSVVLTAAAVLILLTAVAFVFAQRNSGVSISPLRAAGEQMSGRRLEISFNYEKGGVLGSNQFAVWIEDMDGNYVTTLYATNFTARGGYRRRPTSLSQWVSVANPADMTTAQIDAISGATPSAGTYHAVWNFTDKDGNTVGGTEFKYFVEASVSMNDRVLFTGVINAGDEPLTDAPTPTFTNAGNRHNAMISNVVAAYFPR